MGFEEIRAGGVKYFVKEISALINDGNDLFYVYAHYPTTEPDVMVMAFGSRVNAELFCEALNAENECREADLIKHGYWKEPDRGPMYWECSECNYGVAHEWNNTPYCPSCGAKMDGDSK